MKYTTPHHTVMQLLTSKAKRASKWLKVQAISFATVKKSAIYRHVGTAY